MPRQHDLTFGRDEKVWRRIEAGQVRGTEVKASALRLQISIVRERYGARESVTAGKWNGVAETSAGEVTALDCGAINVVCVDDPSEEIPGHALVAMVVKPGDTATQDLVNAARAKIAGLLRIVVAPVAV